MSIGIYDSGLGGLSVWRELRSKIRAPLVYFGDTAHLPYGDKSPEQLREYFRASLAFLESTGCQFIVVACNTTSSVVLPKIKHLLRLPVVGMIEGAVEAVCSAGGRRIGVLATQATAASGVYQNALGDALPGSEVLVQGAPELVPLVEAGEISGPRARTALEKYMEPLLAQGIDSLLLGCTHYSFLAEPITQLLGGEVRLIDPAPAVAGQVQAAWPGAEVSGAETEFWVSAQPKKFKATAELILGEVLPPVYLKMPGEEGS